MDFTIRQAEMCDLSQVKKLAQACSKELGFVLRPALIEAVKEERLLVAELDNSIVGFEEYYHRKRDRQTTLYHKCVAGSFRGIGIGTALVDEVVREAQMLGREFLLLRCPEGLPSNDFHKGYGFVLVGIEPGRKRRLNIWRYNLL
jgi:ribosomal protein S18 acetylase RimI-like enzyme